jgi:hypothetical protein
MRRWRVLSAAGAAAVVGCVLSIVPGAPLANASSNTAPELANGSGGAKACLVWTQGGVVRCFASSDQLKAAEARLRPGGPPTSGAVSANSLCYSYLDLYSGANFTGLELDIWDVGFWVNLSPYGFGGLTVSFANGGCQSYLAKGVNGGVPWYNNSGPWVAVADMGLYWDYSIQSVYVS